MTKLICAVALVCVLIAVAHCTRPSASEATFLVQRHNYGRANPHPPSDGPINQISYQATTSNGLPSMEDVASNYADKCVLAHNPNRGAGFPSGYYVGENIAAFAWSGNTPSNTTQGFLGQSYDFWYGEYVYFYFDSNGRGQCMAGTTCGHYTQVNWNNTLNLGCGYSYCNGGSIGGNWIFVVCNYLQAGNFNGYDAYRQGSGTSSCTPSCPANACGTVTSCGQSIQCSCSSGQYCTASNTCSACPNPCSANSCGSVYESTCGVNVDCGTCSSGNQCTNSICVAPTPTATPTSAASASRSPAASASNSPAPLASNSPAASSSSASSATSTPAPASETSTPAASESNSPAASSSPAASESNSPAPEPSASPSPAPVCDPASQCADLGWSCGAVTLCDQSYSCGGCGSGEQCNNGNCEQIPCGGSCGLNEQCSNNQCVCIDGFSVVNGQCQAPSMPGSIDYSRDFQTTLGPENGWTIPDTELNVVNAGNQVIEWVPAKAVVDEYNTKVNVDLTITGGDFGVCFRKGQTHGGTYYPNDMILFSYRDVGTASEAIYINLFVQDKLTEWGPWSGLTLATGAGQVNHLEFVLSRNDNQNTIDVTLKFARGGYSSSMSASVWADDFPDVGGIGFSFNPKSGSYPSIANTLLATSTTLEVSLYQCLDTTAWTQLFYQATGANPATTTVQARASGQNANCKAAMAGMEVASSMTVVVSSSTISSKALTSSFVAAVQSGNPALASLAIQSAAVVPGTQGAIAAGVPIGASSIPILTAGGAAGGSGLSGGAIAGIVVGSVAGAVLAVGLATAVIVAVVIVAAVVIAKSRSSEEGSNDVEVPTRAPESNRTFRQTIVGLFRPRGGVDVMNGGSKGHQSITARAPAMS